MREIKFRAWDSEYSIMFDSGVFIEADGAIYESAKRTYDTPNTEIALVNFPVMQYVGLKDVGGVEIYEGDIVYLGGYGNYLCEFPFLQLYDAVMESDVGLILGNIFQNPELLKDASDSL